MPQLPSVPKVIRVAVLGSDSADLHVINRAFFSYTGTAPTTAQLNALAAALDGVWNTNLAPLCSASFTELGHQIEDLSSPTSAVGSSVSAHSGTRAGHTLPGGAAAVTSYTIARRYRGGHPRAYWKFGVSEDLTSDQTWSAGFVGAVTTGVAAYMAGVASTAWIGSGTVAQVNVGYYKGFTNFTFPSGRTRPIPKLNPAGPTVDPVTAVLCRPKVGSQRRRNLQSA